MKKITEAINQCLKEFDWKDIVLFKTCVISVGVLIGLAMPWRKKWPMAWAASLVFAATYVPLMGKFLPHLLVDKIPIEEIYN